MFAKSGTEGRVIVVVSDELEAALVLRFRLHMGESVRRSVKNRRSSSRIEATYHFHILLQTFSQWQVRYAPHNGGYSFMANRGAGLGELGGYMARSEFQFISVTDTFDVNRQWMLVLRQGEASSCEIACA